VAICMKMPALIMSKKIPEITSFTRTQSSHHPILRSKHLQHAHRRPKRNKKVQSSEELLILESLPCGLVGFGSTRLLTVSASILWNLRPEGHSQHLWWIGWRILTDINISSVVFRVLNGERLLGRLK
jgi:hypothetical protein